jgi:hypothetical protein
VQHYCQPPLHGLDLRLSALFALTSSAPQTQWINQSAQIPIQDAENFFKLQNTQNQELNTRPTVEILNKAPLKNLRDLSLNLSRVPWQFWSWPTCLVSLTLELNVWGNLLKLATSSSNWKGIMRMFPCHEEILKEKKKSPSFRAWLLHVTSWDLCSATCTVGHWNWRYRSPPCC